MIGLGGRIEALVGALGSPVPTKHSVQNFQIDWVLAWRKNAKPSVHDLGRSRPLFAQLQPHSIGTVWFSGPETQGTSTDRTATDGLMRCSLLSGCLAF
jgi:hypothetical protein